MTEFYTDLRDNVAANLISQFGRAAILRHATGATYDPATGANVVTTDDVPVQVLEVGLPMLLRGAEGRDRFSADLIEQWDSGIIMEAKATAAVGVEPQVDDVLVMGTTSARIKWIEPVAPSGVAVIYKMAVSRL